jgi:hypothetical protein
MQGASSGEPSLASTRLASVLVLIASLAICFALLFYFHNRFWFPRDDGYYAHIADRIANGAFLYRDVQGLHPGGVYYLNALALEIFGHSFLSLRYPLIAAGLVQALLVFVVLRSQGLWIAAAATLLCTALSTVQFFSPAAHWYCLPIAFAVVLLLTASARGLAWRVEAIGFLLVSVFWFRQLTAVFLAIGAVSYLFLEVRDRAAGRGLLARASVLGMAAAIGFYLWSKTDLAGFILFGCGPLALLLATLIRLEIGDRQTLLIVRRLLVGGAIAALPVFLYYLLNGAFADWFRDVFVDAIALGEFEYQRTPRFAYFVLLSLKNLSAIDNPAVMLNGLYWLVLLAAPLVLASTLLAEMAGRKFDRAAIAPLPYIGVFYGMVAIHYQDPAYLYFSAALVFAGLMWTAASRPEVAVVGALLISLVAIGFHAGQPISRSYADLLAGKRDPLVASAIPALEGLYVAPRDEETYRSLTDIIDRYSVRGDPILGIPADPELYFMTGRVNPLRYCFLSFGIRDAEGVQKATEVLEAAPPRVVFHVPSLPYNSPETGRLMDWVRGRYVLLETVREFDVYVPSKP